MALLTAHGKCTFQPFGRYRPPSDVPWWSCAHCSDLSHNQIKKDSEYLLWPSGWGTSSIDKCEKSYRIFGQVYEIDQEIHGPRQKIRHRFFFSITMLKPLSLFHALLFLWFSGWVVGWCSPLEPGVTVASPLSSVPTIHHSSWSWFYPLSSSIIQQWCLHNGRKEGRSQSAAAKSPKARPLTWMSKCAALGQLSYFLLSLKTPKLSIHWRINK